MYLDLLINPDSCNLISPSSGHSKAAVKLERSGLTEAAFMDQAC